MPDPKVRDMLLAKVDELVEDDPRPRGIDEIRLRAHARPLDQSEP
jgi:hypothetical protein